MATKTEEIITALTEELQRPQGGDPSEGPSGLPGATTASGRG